MTAPEFTQSESAGDTPALDARKPRRATRYFFIALGVTVYIVAVSLIGWGKVGDALAGADLPVVALAALLTGAGAILRMWKWRRALGSERHAIGIYFLSRSGGVWSPARVGEFLPLLWRRHRNSRVAGWILFDRVAEIAVTLLLGLAGLAVIHLLPAPALASVIALVAAADVCGVYLLTRSDWLRALARRLREGSRLCTAISALADTAGEFRGFLARPPDLVSMTVVAKCLDLYAVTLIFRALGAPVSGALVAAAKCALAVISYLPITPMTTGIPHTVQGWIMHESAAIQPATVAASVAIEAGIMVLVFSLMALAATRAIRDAAL